MSNIKLQETLDFVQLRKDIDKIIYSDLILNKKLQSICDFLNTTSESYNWVGFYFNNGKKPELKLSCYAGKPTEHQIIPFGKGVCGQVSESHMNLIVADVSKEDNYISCNPGVKSEAVIPIFKNGKNVGQIDIDSHTLDRFKDDDVRFLEYICEKVGEIL